MPFDAGALCPTCANRPWPRKDAPHPHDNCLESEDQIGEPYPKPRKDALQATIESLGAVAENRN